MGSIKTYLNGKRIYRWWFNKTDLNKAYMNKTLVFYRALHIKITDGYSNASDSNGKMISIWRLIAKYRHYGEQVITIEVVPGATVPRIVFDQKISSDNISSIGFINNGYVRAVHESGYGMKVVPGCKITLSNNKEISGGGGRGGRGGDGGASGYRAGEGGGWKQSWYKADENHTTWQHGVDGGDKNCCCSYTILWWHQKNIWDYGRSSSPKKGPVTVNGVKYRRGDSSKGYFKGCWNYPVEKWTGDSGGTSGRPGGKGGAGGRGWWYDATEPDRRKGAPGEDGQQKTSWGYRSGDGGHGGWGGKWGEPGTRGKDGKDGEHGEDGESGKDGGPAGVAIHGVNRVTIKKRGTLHGGTSSY